MADISPFHGIRFNPDKIQDLSGVVTPPYDVISGEEQKQYHDRHPNNVIRLDKNMPTDADSPENNPYTRASRHFTEWLENGILTEDQEPSFYVTTVRFDIEGTPVTRTGLIAAVRLEPFSSGVVLPHEETFSKVKSERLELMKACHANFSHIFSVYSDRNGVSETLQSVARTAEPIQHFMDDAGHEHKVWRITDPDVQHKIRKSFENQRLFIADGHHRYETALNYRQWLKDNGNDFDDNHPANFIMMYLCAVEDPGLIILPTHRLLSGIPENARKKLLADAKAFFDVETVTAPGADPVSGQDAARRALAAKMRDERKNHVIGLVMKNEPAYYFLRLKEGVMASLFADDIPGPLMGLDVTVLTRLIFLHLMGFEKKDLDDETLMHYTSRDDDAVDSVQQGENDIAFLLNPPTNEQVRLIAEAGYTMPRKTTFYYPKVVTGQVMNRLER